jgi:SAM-dependent methyltransferase
MTEEQVRDFWEHHPCGDMQAGGLSQYGGDYEAFFTQYDRLRYQREGHILAALDAIDLKGKRVLEIGLGQGADSEQIVRRGALWSGLDLTPESVARVQTRFSLRQLPYESLKQGSVLGIPHQDASFDIVLSHGVLHHVPEILKAQREVHRVLRPDGELIVMLYARRSLNYLVSISVIRRLALTALYLTGRRPGGMLGQHIDNARAVGLAHYLRMENFIHRNTDGPLNPYSKVYDLAEVAKDFPKFKIVRSYQLFSHAPPLPVSRLPLGRLLGWHLWVHMRPL